MQDNDARVEIVSPAEMLIAWPSKRGELGHPEVVQQTRPGTRLLRAQSVASHIKIVTSLADLYLLGGSRQITTADIVIVHRLQQRSRLTMSSSL